MDLQPNQTAFLFPGQGSQAVGMGWELAQAYPTAHHIFNRADNLLDFQLSHLAWQGPEDELNDTINTQPALFVHSMAALQVFRDYFPGFQPALVAGHSMGELSALVAAGALTFAETLQLVRTRGRLMKEAGEASPGGMAAILGLDISVLEKICADASSSEAGNAGASQKSQTDIINVVQVANDNCPGQVVISGSRQAIERALSLAQQAGARRAVALPISIAAHSPLMAHAQVDFNRAVQAAPLTAPTIPLVGNVTATPLTKTDQIRADLHAQLTHRVRWTDSIQYMIAQGITTFLEVGTGSVLTGLLKRIDRQVQGIPLGTPADFEKITTSGV